jgi:hypothetical protein
MYIHIHIHTYIHLIRTVKILCHESHIVVKIEGERDGKKYTTIRKTGVLLSPNIFNFYTEIMKIRINNVEFNILYFADNQVIIHNLEDYLKTPYICVCKLSLIASIAI